jgi:plastocyanin
MFSIQSRWKMIAGGGAAGVLAIVLAAALPGAPPPRPPTNPAQAPMMKPMMNPSPPAANVPGNAGRFFSPAFGAPFTMPTYGGYGGMGYSATPGYPYAPMGSGYGGMGYGRGGGMGYGRGAGTEVGGAGEETESTDLEAARETKTVSQMLKASGLPNQDGRLTWPVGLRILPSPRAAELREQIDALIQQEAEQAAGGAANSRLDRELATAIDELSRLLRRDEDERFSLTFQAYEDAYAFLGKLKHAEASLAGGLEPPGGKAQLEAREGKVAEVGLYDNRFDPKTLTVTAGTIVRWKNQGRHDHTVTSDKGDWGSNGLGPGKAFSHAFTRPGTYTYHCEIHPDQMRGTVIVK